MTSASPIAQTKPLMINLINQRLSAREVAEELNHRKLYMSSGASWNAGRIDIFLTKHQITRPTYQ